MQSPDVSFTLYAQEAIKHYPLHKASISFIRHNENITFCVLDQVPQQKYLLRIHKPINLEFAPRQSVILESELLWLENIARDMGALLLVKQPVRNMRGQFVTYIQVEGDRTPCTLLKWIAGETLKQRADVTTAIAGELGYVVVLLHQHAKNWRRPAEFMRPIYDHAYFRRQIDSLSKGIDAGIFTAKNFVAMQHTAESVLIMLTSLDNDKTQWGLIHCDLHYGNYLICQDKVCPIDFSLCGFGYFLFDIGTCLAALPGVEQRQAFINNYAKQVQHPFTADQLHIINGCSLLSRICAFAFALPNPLQHIWLKERIPRFISEECQASL
jgi:Ser/Thr protein kinase RdoA (MazF antagonist)